MTLNPPTPGLDYAELRVLALLAHRWYNHGAVGSTNPAEHALLTRLRQAEAARAAADTASPAALRAALIESVPMVTHPGELSEAVERWFDDGPSARHPATDEPLPVDCDDIAALVEALNQASGLTLVALWKTYDDEDEDDAAPFDDFLGLHIQDANGRLFSMAPTWAPPTDAELLKDRVAALADPRAWVGELTDHTAQDCFYREPINYALDKFYYH